MSDSGRILARKIGILFLASPIVIGLFCLAFTDDDPMLAYFAFTIGLIAAVVALNFLSDDGKEEKGDREKVDEIDKAFKDVYTDTELSNRIGEYIHEPANEGRVWEEFSATLSWKKHWDEYKQVDSNLILRIHDTLLANRGKVRELTSYVGVCKARQDKRYDYTSRESAYEWAEAIRDILRERGADIDLLYDNKEDRYIWKNSHAHAVADLNYILPFDRATLVRPTDDLPPPLEKIR